MYSSTGMRLISIGSGEDCRIVQLCAQYEWDRTWLTSKFYLLSVSDSSPLLSINDCYHKSLFISWLDYFMCPLCVSLYSSHYWVWAFQKWKSEHIAILNFFKLVLKIQFKNCLAWCSKPFRKNLVPNYIYSIVSSYCEVTESLVRIKSKYRLSSPTPTNTYIHKHLKRMLKM